MTTPAKRNPKQEFKELLTRKQMLQEVLGVADRIEQLHSGLHSAMQMGQQTSQIDADLLARSGEVEALRHLPPAKLKDVLGKLEARMMKSIQRVVAYAEQELDDSNAAEFEHTALELINDFRRSSKTALAMRLLLSEQGYVTKPVQLPVDPAELRQQVGRMGEREKAVRTKVEKEIVAIHDDSLNLLKTPNLPEPIKQMLQQTVAQMQSNLDHVRSGKGFDTMPHPVEILEGKEAEEVEELVEALPVMEVEEVTIEEITIEEITIEEIECPPLEPVEPASKSRGLGFGKKLNNWLNSPVDVGWEEAAKDKTDKET